MLVSRLSGGIWRFRDLLHLDESRTDSSDTFVLPIGLEQQPSNWRFPIGTSGHPLFHRPYTCPDLLSSSRYVMIVSPRHAVDISSSVSLLTRNSTRHDTTARGLAASLAPAAQVQRKYPFASQKTILRNCRN